jgi:hypothetical protein
MINRFALNKCFNVYILVTIKCVSFNATFNNISVTLRPSVLLVEETGILGENHRKALTNFIT